MKSAIALIAGAALTTATVTTTQWVYEVVTVTVTADPTDFVQNSKPTSTSTPEPAPVTTSAAPAPPPPAANAAAEQPTSEAPPPPPATTSTPEPVVVSTPEPAPQSTQTQQPEAQPETLSPDGSYQQTAVDYHNAYRRDHSAGDLVWDETLAQYAANTANGCVFEHDMTQGGGNYHYGQNLASYGASGDLGTLSNAVGNAIAEQWYGEYKNYNFYGQSDPPPGVDFNSIGHYTQMVWKSTQKFGCFTAKCPAGTVLGLPSVYTVCNYSPPGNFQGQYGANVLPSLGLKINLST